MKFRISLFAVPILLFSTVALFAEPRVARSTGDAPFTEAPSDVTYWVTYWQKPAPVIFGSEQEAFQQNMHDVSFALNVYDQPLDPSAVDADAQWLKDHASDRFYIEGYASSDGNLGYNLSLSRRRAEWVKQALISKGVAESRIVLATPWGQLYPTCAELDDSCWSKNRLVHFVYSPATSPQ
jgi:outer membrane protein OmpA-like peptidoglycan-associated protein